jgi:hypothetical protein
MDANALWLASLTLTQFRAFRKAFDVLRRAGIDDTDAITMLREAASRRNNYGMTPIRHKA